MMRTIRIAAVGDILMWKEQIAAAKRKGAPGYSFHGMFSEAAPYLRSAHLTIGNLETTLSGRELHYVKRNPRTGWPMFNCPDELARALKRAGFHVLTTANNHCMDRGTKGLRRTLRVLDNHGLAHTGTFRTKAEAGRFLIRQVNGIKVGILSYTYGTNAIPVPSSTPWLVNRINRPKMIADLQKLRPKADLIIVCLHFGKEFRTRPSASQRSLASTLMKHGADIILGAHPHVIQPMALRNGKFVIYSLGNFISKRMLGSLRSQSGMILKLTVKKNAAGHTRVTHASYVPTYSYRTVIQGKPHFRVLPVKKHLSNPTGSLAPQTVKILRQVWRNTTSMLRGRPR